MLLLDGTVFLFHKELHYMKKRDYANVYATDMYIFCILLSDRDEEVVHLAQSFKSQRS